MANDDHLARLRKGARVWNQWRDDNPKIIPDLKKAYLYQAKLSYFNFRDAVLSNANLDKGFLRHADLVGAQLGGASLKMTDCRGVDCRGASLRGAQLDGANLDEANLRSAKLDSARLFKATLESCNLTRANLVRAKLTNSNLRSVCFAGADLSNARLDGADFSCADFSEANLRHANLQNATARGAIFKLAILHQANFDGTDISGSHLWETQRTEWSIKDVTCETVFWDEEAKVASKFEPGEFERLYGNQLVIELFYAGGITAFEVNTLPALLHELSKLHPNCRLRLASVVETNGGALITIRAEGIQETDLSLLRIDAEALRDLQIALRESNRLNERLTIEKSLLLDDVFPRMIGKMTNTVNIVAPTKSLAIGFGHSSPQVTDNEGVDSDALLELIREIKGQLANLPPKQSLAIEIAEAIEMAQESVTRKKIEPSLVAKTLKALRELLLKAVMNEATSVIGEHLPQLLKQLEHVIGTITQ